MQRRWFVAIAAVAVSAAIIGLLQAVSPAENSRTLQPEPITQSVVRKPESSADAQPPVVAPAPQPITTSPPEVKQVRISFPDGETVAVQLKGLPPDPLWSRPVSRPIEHYAELRRRAIAGEATAAMWLYADLDYCRSAYADEASFQQALRQLRQGEVVKFPDPRRVPLKAHTAAEVTEFERLLRHPYEYCQGTTEQQMQEAETWLRMAADAGEYWAQQRAATLLGNNREGVAAWESLWAQGYTSALPPLAIYHHDGIDGAPADYVRAYAYKLVNFKLAEAGYRNPPTSMISPVLQAMQDSLDYSGGFLDPQQHAAAVQLAQRLLIENQNCCIGSW